MRSGVVGAAMWGRRKTPGRPELLGGAVARSVEVLPNIRRDSESESRYSQN
jgi:hypothetical protein